MALFNRLYNSPFFASNEYQRNAHICGTDAFTQKLDNIFSTAQDNVIAERYEEHGGSGEGPPALLYSACVVVLLLLLCCCTVCL